VKGTNRLAAEVEAMIGKRIACIGDTMSQCEVSLSGRWCKVVGEEIPLELVAQVFPRNRLAGDSAQSHTANRALNDRNIEQLAPRQGDEVLEQ